MPLYVQIADRLLRDINKGLLAEGDPFPSEEELSRSHGVSRMTARHALQSLKMRGYAMSMKGRGTYVSLPKFEKDGLHLQSFTDEMKRNRAAPSSRVLEQIVLKAGDEIGALLQISSATQVLKLYRLRYANREPINIETTYLSLDRFPGLHKLDFGRLSLYRVLHDTYHIRSAWAEEVIESLQASPAEAKMLEIHPKASLLRIRRVTRLETNEPIEYATSLYRGDRYQAKLRRLLTLLPD